MSYIIAQTSTHTQPLAITDDLLRKAERLANYIGNRRRSNRDIFAQGIDKSEVEKIIVYWKTLWVQPTSEPKRYKVLKIQNSGNCYFYYSLTTAGKLYYEIDVKVEVEVFEPTNMRIAMEKAYNKAHK